MKTAFCMWLTAAKLHLVDVNKWMALRTECWAVDRSNVNICSYMSSRYWSGCTLRQQLGYSETCTVVTLSLLTYWCSAYMLVSQLLQSLLIAYMLCNLTKDKMPFELTLWLAAQHATVQHCFHAARTLCSYSVLRVSYACLGNKTNSILCIIVTNSNTSL